MPDQEYESLTSLHFNDLPLPPSSNKQYVSFMRRGKIIHARAPELVEFRKKFDVWCLQNWNTVQFSKRMFMDKPYLHVHANIYFEKSRIFTKKGELKSLDVSNRLKALHDALADAIGIDDRYFVACSCIKHYCERAEQERADVEMRIYDWDRNERTEKEPTSGGH